MPLESCFILVDNSEFSRNSDYTPTRLEAQHDASNLICGSKTQQNPESTVGVATLAPAVEVLCSPTDDMGRLLGATSSFTVGGKANFAAGLQIAQLVLKNRRNKNGGQRVVLFCASPVEVEEKRLVKIGKQLKKANIAVDIVSMGETDVNESKLNALLEAVNKNNNSHLVTIPKGVLPSDVLITSPIITGEEGGGGEGGMGGGGGPGAFAEYGGVDPNLDPELAIALRVSMEEARAEAERKAAADGDAPAAADASSSSDDQPAKTESSTPGPSAAAPASGDMEMDDDAMLQQALMMSMMDAEGSSSSSSSSAAAADDKPKSEEKSGDAASFLDPGFVKGLLTGLPGVDVNDPKIQAAMSAVGGQGEKDGEEDGDDDDSGEKKKKKKKKESE